ncbi:hypothetical protein K2X30_12955 [bacterium]|jgi:hypothetical protein|nr:hypothetical protein [bacterium]
MRHQSFKIIRKILKSGDFRLISGIALVASFTQWIVWSSTLNRMEQVIRPPAYVHKTGILNRMFASTKSDDSRQQTADMLEDVQVGLRNGIYPDAEELFDPVVSKEMHYKFDRMSRDYESRRYQNLLTPQQERAYNDQINSLKSEIYGHVRNRQTEKIRRSAADGGDLNDDDHKPVAIAVAAAAVYAGQPVTLNIDGDSRISARTDVQNRRGEFKLWTSWVDWSLIYTGDAPDRRYTISPDPTQGDERYRFSVSKQIPVVNLGSSLTYGSTSGGVTASVSHQLFIPRLNVMYDSTYYLNPSIDDRLAEQALKFFYNVNF